MASVGSHPEGGKVRRYDADRRDCVQSAICVVRLQFWWLERDKGSFGQQLGEFCGLLVPQRVICDASIHGVMGEQCELTGRHNRDMPEAAMIGCAGLTSNSSSWNPWSIPDGLP